MRVIFFIIIAAFLKPLTSLAQTVSPSDKAVRPSQKQMQEQVREAKSDAQKQIADLEKQIADAKERDDDPQSIKDMEGQLAMMKKMLGVIDKAGSQITKPKTPSVAKTVIPKFVSPFVPITLVKPINAPTKEQATDQLFWYTGKKIDKNTLVTTGGLVVRHDIPNNRLILEPNKQKDTFYYGLIKCLSQTATMKNDYVVKMNGMENSFYMFPEIFMAYKEFDFRNDLYYDLAKNTIDLPLVPVEYLDPDLEKMHNHLVVMRDKLIEEMNNLPPVTRGTLVEAPERPHGLCWCDSIPLIAFKQRLPQWGFDFYKEEKRLWSEIVDMSNQMETFLAKGGKPIPNWNATIFKAKSLRLERESNKLLALLEIYEDEKNIFKEDALAEAATTVVADMANFQAILEGDEALKEQAAFRVKRSKDMIFKSFFKDYIENQKSHRNYNELFDYALYAGHEHNKKVFDVNYGVPDNLYNVWMRGLDKFNRFTFAVNMDFELEIKDEKEALMIADGFLKSDQMIVGLGQFNCKWQLYNKDVDNTDRTASDEKFHIPIKIVQGKKDYLRDKYPPFLYEGPEYMQMVFPSFRISFCKDGNGLDIPDSVYMDVLRYGDAGLAAHKNVDVARHYSIDMLAYANKMFLGIIKTEGNKEELIDLADRMLDVNGSTGSNFSSTGNAALDQLMMEFLTNQQKLLLQSELSETTHTEKTVIPFDAQSVTHVLMQETYNTVDHADQDLKAGIKLIRGLIIIRVHHSPLP